MQTLDNLQPSPAVKGMSGWKAETWVHVAPGHALRISTVKDWSHAMIHTRADHMEAHPGNTGMWSSAFNGYTFELETTMAARASEKLINSIHARLVTRDVLAAHVDTVRRNLDAKARDVARTVSP